MNAPATAPVGDPEPERDNPYPGLRPFRRDEYRLFFGREEHIDELLERLRMNRFLAVVGGSGSGKSSLVLAGLLPRLDGGFSTESGSYWRTVTMHPGGEPIRNLALALDHARQGHLALLADENDEGDEHRHDGQPSTAVAGPDLDLDEQTRVGMLCATLAHSDLGLTRAVASLELESDENLLIVVDQFEELFRFQSLAADRPADDPSAADSQRDEPRAFVNLLLASAAQSDVPIYIMLTMRTDYLGECVRFPGLPERINSGQYLVPMLSRRQREEAIVGPLRAIGADLSPPLLQLLLNDADDPLDTDDAAATSSTSAPVPAAEIDDSSDKTASHGDMPELDEHATKLDQLPVLQHALMRTFDLWAEQSDRVLITVEDYRRAGGKKRALSRHATEAYRSLSADDRHVAKWLFRCLTEPGPTGRGIRRPSRVDEVLEVAGTDIPTLARVVEAFRVGGRSFVVVRPEGELTLKSEIDISHESLMRVWPMLRAWTRAEISDADQLQHIARSARRRDAGAGGLWRDPDLALALQWLARVHPSSRWSKRYGVDLAKVTNFLDDSKVEQDRIRSDEERERQERLELLERNATKLRRRAWLAVAACVVAMLAAGYAWDQRADAKQQAEQAKQAEAKAIEAREEAKENAELAARLMEDALVAEETAKQLAEKANQHAKEARVAQEAALDAKRRADDEAEHAKAARADAERRRRQAQAARRDAEEAAAKAGAAAADEKQAREDAEQARIDAEKARQDAEQARLEAEKNAREAEAGREALNVKGTIPTWRD